MLKKLGGLVIFGGSCRTRNKKITFVWPIKIETSHVIRIASCNEPSFCHITVTNCQRIFSTIFVDSYWIVSHSSHQYSQLNPWCQNRLLMYLLIKVSWLKPTWLLYWTISGEGAGSSPAPLVFMHIQVALFAPEWVTGRGLRLVAIVHKVSCFTLLH